MRARCCGWARRMTAVISSPLAETTTQDWRSVLNSFVLGSGPAVLQIPSALASFHLAYSDVHQPDCLSKNQRAGWYGPTFQPDTLYRKTCQHAAIKSLTPDLAFDGFSVASVDDIPSQPSGIMTARPDLSAGSRGSAVFLGLGPQQDQSARAFLKNLSGPYQVHRFEHGTPFFINGVVRAGQLYIADVWECFTLVSGCRPVLVSVIDMAKKAVDPALTERLEVLLQGLGLRNGPVHFELIQTSRGPRLIKCAARLATDPLPALCDLQGISGQVGLLLRYFCQEQSASSSASGSPVQKVPKAQRHVADYSFIHTQPGRISGLKQAAMIESIPGFSHYYMAPKVNKYTEATQDGYSYAATLFLSHESKQTLRDSISRLDLLNIAGALNAEAEPHRGAHPISPLRPNTITPLSTLGVSE